MSKKTTIHTIPNDAIVKLPVSGAFHGRILHSYMRFASKFSKEKMIKLTAAIKDKKIDDLSPDDRDDATTLETFITIINTLEALFKAEGVIESKEVELPTSD